MKETILNSLLLVPTLIKLQIDKEQIALTNSKADDTNTEKLRVNHIKKHSLIIFLVL